MTTTRRLAAILAADVAGYSRLMGADEEGTLAALKAIRHELVGPKIAEHRGRGSAEPCRSCPCPGVSL
jgi:adenylate cyclase